MTDKLLDRIDDAADVRKLKRSQLPQLCAEVRDCLIDTVSKTSGHLASGLGVVELTVALHYVYNTPQDKLIWDVGHQAYPHKILTGHRKELATIRQKGGLHAFIWRGETPYDLISSVHASTSIGSALGLAVAERNLGSKNRVVAVIGDGALSGGCAFEALDHASSVKDINLTVILNDNEMSISENVGALAMGLARVLSNPHYVKLVEGGKKVLEKLPSLRTLALRAQEHAKGMVMPGTLFEEFGFNYIGPVDGHDVMGLVDILQNIKDMPGLQFLHVVTRKGKGYAPAEANPISHHGAPAFNPEEAIHPTPMPADHSFSACFGRWICDMAEKDSRLIGITPAMCVGSAMEEFAQRFPRQYFDVAIAEQHSLVFASGLAAGGLKPVVAIYSSFLQRAYDGLIHDAAIQDLPIVFAVDRAGIVGPDGPTHQGVFDIAYSKGIPNLIIMAPCSRAEQYRMLNTAYRNPHPCIVRYPRANSDDDYSELTLEDEVEIGKGRILREGKSAIAVAAFGPLGAEALKIAADYDLTVADMRFIKPLDQELIAGLAARSRILITLEEGAVLGGIGEEVAALVQGRGKDCRVINLGVPDRFIMECTRKQALADLGLDAAGLAAFIDRLSQPG